MKSFPKKANNLYGKDVFIETIHCMNEVCCWHKILYLGETCDELPEKLMRKYGPFADLFNIH